MGVALGEKGTGRVDQDGVRAAVENQNQQRRASSEAQADVQILVKDPLLVKEYERFRAL